MKKSKSLSPKLDRKIVEKNRRIQMKALCFKLSSLIPPNFKHAKEKRTQQDQLDQAAAYIMHMKERLENLKKRKEALSKRGDSCSNYEEEMVTSGFRIPVVEVRDFGSNIEIVVISGLNRNFKLYPIVAILEEEGAHVVAASYSTLSDKIFYSIHAQVKISRVGVETSRISQRLQELVSLSSM